MSELEIRTVFVSSVFEDTPEGLFRMDRLRRAYEAARAPVLPDVRDAVDRIDAAIDAATFLPSVGT